MKLLGWSLLWIALLCSSANADELHAELLAKVKDRTVLVMALDPESLSGPSRPSPVGSGLVYQSDERCAYIITNAHVVTGLQNIAVVWGAGGTDEKMQLAELTGIDVNQDLAVLRVADPPHGDMPAVEAILPPETATVYAAGHPFGNILAMNQRNSPVTVVPGQVSSIKRDEEDKPALIQLNIDLHPGNSGGPIFDKEGRLVGIATAKIVGTLIGLIIPANTVAAFLKGCVTDVEVRQKTIRDGKLIVRVTARICNTSNQIAAVYICAATRVAGGARPKKSSPISVNKYKLELSGNEASYEFSLDPRTDLTYLFQTALVFRDNETRYGPIKEFLVKDGAKYLNSMPALASTPNSVRNEEWLGAGVTQSVKHSETKRTLLGPVTEKAGVRVTRVCPALNQPIVDICWARDYKSFFTLSKDGVVRRIRFPEIIEDRTIALDTQGLSMTMSSLGPVLYSGLTREIWVLDADTLNLIRTIKKNPMYKLVSSPCLSIAFGVMQSESQGRPGIDRDRSLGTVDLKSGSFVERKPVTESSRKGIEFSDIALAPSGEVLLVTDKRNVIYRYRVISGDIVLASSTRSANNGDISISEDSRYYRRDRWISSLDRMEEPILRLENRPECLVFDPVNRRLFMWLTRLHAVDLKTGRERDVSVAPTQDTLYDRYDVKMVIHPNGNDILQIAGSSIFWFQIIDANALFH